MVSKNYKTVYYITAYNKYSIVSILLYRTQRNNNINNRINKLNSLLNGEDILTAEDYKIALDNIKTVDSIVYNGNLDYLQYINDGGYKQLNLSNGKQYNFNDMFKTLLVCYKEKSLLIKKHWNNKQQLNIYTNKYNIEILNKKYKEITNNNSIQDFNYIDFLSMFIKPNINKYNYIPFIEYVTVINGDCNNSRLFLRVDRFYNENYKEYKEYAIGRNILGLQNE